VAASAADTSLSALWSTGTNVIANIGTTGTFTNVATLAVGAAAGDVVQQGLQIAFGLQESFSWQEVGESALGSVIGSEVLSIGGQGGVGQAVFGKGAVAVAANVAATRALTEGVGDLIGLNNGFSWKQVEGAVLSSALSSAITAAAQPSGNTSPAANPLNNVAAQSILGVTTSTAADLAQGGKINWTKVIGDGFGNALGTYLGDQAFGQNGSNVGEGIGEGHEEALENLRRFEDTYTSSAAAGYVSPGDDTNIQLVGGGPSQSGTGGSAGPAGNGDTNGELSPDMEKAFQLYENWNATGSLASWNQMLQMGIAVSNPRVVAPKSE
jgi:hypothetical protein